MGKLKKIRGFLVFLLVSLLSLSLVSAGELTLVCLNKGDMLKFSECNPAIPDRTCGSDLGCQYCTSYNNFTDVYCPALINKCNSFGLVCSFIENSTLDSQPPQFTLFSPQQDFVYNSRSVMLNIDVNEKSSIYYIDNNENRGRWSRVCTGCWNYARKRSFDEGFNDLTFKAKDVVGNEIYFDVSFFVDSKKPKIRKTYPNRGFASGEFEVQFSEKNPVSLILDYGNIITGYRNHSLNLSKDCYLERSRNYCQIEVDVRDYDGEQLFYFFNLTDIAGVSKSSKIVDLEVDTTPPLITNFNYSSDYRYVIFNISVIESNFDEINYIDWSDSRPRWRRLCSRLREDTCIKKKAFREGFHSIDIEVVDDAGNSAGKHIDFFHTY